MSDERIRYERYQNNSRRSAETAASDEVGLGPRKTMLVLVIVVGCFAVLWPKIFHPMLVGSSDQPTDPNTGCCDVISDVDVNLISILTELCKNMMTSRSESKDIVRKCKSEILETCGIDISAVLQEQIKLGRSFKQILEGVRSLNGSLCLKYNFGVLPSTLGYRYPDLNQRLKVFSIKQERPHLKAEMMHPAFRERGNAIPHTQAPPPRPTHRIIEGKPGPIPGMRPPMGGPGHVVQPSQKGSSVGILMPMYTVGIVIFFSYTLLKIIFKKQPNTVQGSLYPSVEPDATFRRDVFEAAKSNYYPTKAKVASNSPLVVNAMSALLDEVDQEIAARQRAQKEVESARVANGNVSNGSAVIAPQEEEQTSVKVLGMEMTASCEGGQKWSRPDSPIIPTVTSPSVQLNQPAPEIYLEGALPAQSQLLVSESATEAQEGEKNDPAVVLAGKVTLSVISMDNQETEDGNGSEEKQRQINDLIEVNGDDDEIVEESKYTTASSATAAERDISEGEQTDDEANEVNIDVLDDSPDQIDFNDDYMKPNHVNDNNSEE